MKNGKDFVRIAKKEDERTARQKTAIFFEIWSLFLQVFDPVLIDMQL